MKKRVWVCAKYVVFIDENEVVKWFFIGKPRKNGIPPRGSTTYTLTSNPLDLCPCYDNTGELSIIVLKPQTLSLYRFSNNGKPNEEEVLKRGDFRNCSLSQNLFKTCRYLNSLPGRYEFAEYFDGNFERPVTVNIPSRLELKRKLGEEGCCIYLTTSNGKFRMYKYI